MNFTYRLIRDADRTIAHSGEIELRIALPLLTPAAYAAPMPTELPVGQAGFIETYAIRFNHD